MKILIWLLKQINAQADFVWKHKVYFSIKGLSFFALILFMLILWVGFIITTNHILAPFFALLTIGGVLLYCAKITNHLLRPMLSVFSIVAVVVGLCFSFMGSLDLIRYYTAEINVFHYFASGIFAFFGTLLSIVSSYMIFRY